MAERSEMAPEEIEQYLASPNDDLYTIGPLFVSRRTTWH